MNIFTPPAGWPGRWRPAAALLLALAGGCETLQQAVLPSAHPNYYALAYAPPAQARAAAAGPTLIVSPPFAAAGFDSRHMMYVRQTDQLEYFAHNEWIDTPARMLAPLIVAAVESSGGFRAVVQTPSSAIGELRLDTEILRLQHEFTGTPSRVRLTLRAHLVDNATRRIIASREFEAVADSASEDPRGGVVAAHRAVNSALAELAQFCAQAAGSGWSRDAAGSVPR